MESACGLDHAVHTGGGLTYRCNRLALTRSIVAPEKEKRNSFGSIWMGFSWLDLL